MIADHAPFPPLLVPLFQKLGLNTARADASFKLMDGATFDKMVERGLLASKRYGPAPIFPQPSRGHRMKIYSMLHDESGPEYYAKKADAMVDAIGEANYRARSVEVFENTIVGPISRELVCALLNGHGWSSETLTVEIVWPTDKAARKAAREQSARADTIMLGARKAAPAQPDGGAA